LLAQFVVQDFPAHAEIGSMSKKAAKEPKLKPWDRRPWPIAGDLDLTTIYAAAGRALSQWERYEGVLSLLFSAFVAGTETQAAKRAYVSVRTFEGRAEMLRAASSAYFTEKPNHGSLQEPFKTILRDATSFAPRRNEIAHGVVDYFWLRDAKPERGEPVLEERFGLYPSYASFRERSITNDPTYCYTSAELDYFFGQFLRLGNEASGLVGHVLKVRKRPSLRRLYEPDPP
jgi:hypothetical protein